MTEPFLPLVEDFIAQVQETRRGQLKMSVDQFRYFWTRLEHVFGATEVNRCARAACTTCGEEHLFSELFHLTRYGEKRVGKCGHQLTQLLVTWSE